MSPINKIMLGVLILAGVMVLGGCGSSAQNSQTLFDTATQQHPAGWLPAGHAQAAQADATACQECHGADYTGGISRVPCSQCHLGGYNNVHPTAWGTSIDLSHGPYVQSSGSSACANAACHGTSLTGVAQSGPSCTSCHLGGIDSVHPANWGTPIALNHAQYVAANGTGSCANAACHGADLTGSTGPSCTLCHLGGATSVHPSDWTPPAFANHAQFVRINGVSACQNNYCHGSSLTGVVDSGPSCTSCHLGGVYAVHPAIFSIPTVTLPGHAIYVLNTGSAYSCANTSCHGANLQGVPGSGPSCASCHEYLP